MNKNEYSNQFPIKEKKVKYKHDFKIVDGYVIFNFLGKEKKITGFEFINWLRENYFEDYFDYIVYKWHDFNIIKVPINNTKNIVRKNTKTKEYEILKKMPNINNPKILGVRPKNNNPISLIEDEYYRREEEKRESQNDLLKTIENDNLNNERYIQHYKEYIKENFIKKGILASGLALGALNGHSQQKVNNFSEYQSKKNIKSIF